MNIVAPKIAVEAACAAFLDNAAIITIAYIENITPEIFNKTIELFNLKKYEHKHKLCNKVTPFKKL